MKRNELSAQQLQVKQIDIEKACLDLGIEKFHKSVADACEHERSADNSYARALTNQVTIPVVEYITEWASNSRSMYVLPLKELKLERVVIIGLRTLFNKLSLGSEKYPSQSDLCNSIGDAIQLELKMQSLMDNAPEYMKEVETNWKSKRAQSVRHKSNVVNHILTDKGMSWDHWTPEVKAGVGGVVLTALLKATDLFEVKIITRNRRSKKYIQFTEPAIEWISKHNDFMASMRPIHRPMITPPNSWQGGKPYCTDAMNSTIEFVRVRSGNLRKHYGNCADSMLEALDLAQSTRWRINRKMYNFMTEVKGLRHGILVPSGYMEEKPDYPLPKELQKEDMTEEQATIFRDWKSVVRTLYTKDVARRSNRQRLEMSLSIAEEYLEYDTIYFPHSIDNRGRIYSIPTVLQPQGDDICKGILEFSDGERLTAIGVQQLKLQIASKYGYDKASHKERLDWFNANERAIVTVANNPIDHIDWLKEADSPFQTLSAMFAYAEWKANPDAVIHARANKDGACNGLQHFSAMLKDGDLGRSVNLTPSTLTDTPNSIYKVIAEETQMLLESRTGQYDQMWVEFWKIYGRDGQVDYKCMKRPVMTLPYSATMFSRMQYIKEFIRDKGAHTYFGKEFGIAVKHLADVVTEAMDRRIPSATSILDWLMASCKIILKADRNIEWHTPMGFHVKNYKAKTINKEIKLCYEGKSIKIVTKTDIDKVDITRMASAIAPNFVHSMDACHMLMLVKACHENNITQLHLVHDDYGCHVNHGDYLAQLAKYEFAKMYITNNPLREFYELNKDIIEEPPEMLNTLELSKIPLSAYAFD